MEGIPLELLVAHDGAQEGIDDMLGRAQPLHPFLIGSIDARDSSFL
jgi:hypothetical protein